MRHGQRFSIALGSLLALLGTAPVSAAELPRHEPMRWQLAVLPLGRFVSFLVAPLREQPAHDGESALVRSDGWRSLRFPVDDHGLGVYLAVEGEAQFDIAYIDYDDGTQDRFELSQARRANGLFVLAEFTADRPVTRVSVLAHAVSPEAHISILLGR
jgi:hypothetical protein